MLRLSRGLLGQCHGVQVWSCQWMRGAVLAAIFLMASLSTSPHARADEAEAASARFSIAVLLSAPSGNCFTTGSSMAVRQFVRKRIDAINARPEFEKRRVRLDVYYDDDNTATAIANVRQALADPTTIAMIGQSGTARSKDVFAAVEKDLAARGIPFITDLGVTSIFEKLENVFTMRPSQENEQIPVIARFLQDGLYQRPVYIGTSGNAASANLIQGLSELTGTPPLQSIYELKQVDDKLDSEAIATTIGALREKNADLIIAMLPGKNIEQFLTESAAAGLKVPIMLVTDVDKALKTTGAASYPGTLYQLAWQTLPDVYSKRLRREMQARSEENWIFEDVKNSSAPGWSDGKCKMPEDQEPVSQYTPANLRAIGRGTRYADMVGIVGEIIRFTTPDATAARLRSMILKGLKTTYATGRGTYRGAYDNWSFDPKTRTASQLPVILTRKAGGSHVQLAPRQYVRAGDNLLRPIQTLYIDVNPTRIFRVDDNEKSFSAEFYLSIASAEKFPIEDLEFGNAFQNDEGTGQKVTVVSLNTGPAADVYPKDVAFYKVTGKFMMRPDFERYPFDSQLFSIELKPKNGAASFIVQPPPERLRDTALESEGWSVKDQYAAYDEDYVPVANALTDEKSIVPFYAAEYAWIMQREGTDYYLRVVIPLGFILAVAYLSIFIPREHFEAIVTIQVTALLSAVALYLSIPKIGSDTATVSDRIFLFNYMAVSAMIAISIMAQNARIVALPYAKQVLRQVHIWGVPLLLLVLIIVVYLQTTSSYVPSWSGE